MAAQQNNSNKKVLQYPDDYEFRPCSTSHLQDFTDDESIVSKEDYDESTVHGEEEGSQAAFNINSNYAEQETIGLSEADEATTICLSDHDGETTTIGLSDDEMTLQCSEDELGLTDREEEDDELEQESSSKTHWDRAQFEPVNFDLSELNKEFCWKKYRVGIVVEHIRKRSTNEIVYYKIWPFCTGETKAYELILDKNETDKTLQLGQWIKFERNDIFNENINADTWKPQEPMFHSMPMIHPFTKQETVVMECQLRIHPEKSREISTKWYQWLTKVEEANGTTRTPFIRCIYGRNKLVKKEHLGTTPWATIEYTSKNGEGYWRLTSLRHKYYGEF